MNYLNIRLLINLDTNFHFHTCEVQMKISWRRLVILFFTVILLLLMAFNKYPDAFFASLFHRDIVSTPISVAHSTTLLETWNIVQDYIDSYEPDSVISEIVSVDHPGDVKLLNAPGTDGKRRAWMATIINTKKSTSTRLTIWDDEVVNHTVYPLDLNLSAIKKPILDSFDTYKLAFDSYPIQPGDKFSGTGIHFGIGIDEDGKQVISVLGGKGKESLTNDLIIEIDPINGNIIKKLSRSFDKAGGVLFSNDSGVSWSSSNLVGKMTTAAAKDPSEPESGYAVTTDGDQITVYHSSDSGKTWTEFSKLPPYAGNWPTSISAVLTSFNARIVTLIVTTRQGAWVSSGENSDSWSQAANLPQAPIQWSAILSGQKGSQVFISIIDGTEKENGLYVSSDLINWKQIKNGGYFRLSESFDGKQVIAIDQNRHYRKSHYEAGESGSIFQRWTSFLSCLSDC